MSPYSVTYSVTYGITFSCDVLYYAARSHTLANLKTTTAVKEIPPANGFDDSRWNHGRIKVGNNTLDSLSIEDGIYIAYISCLPPIPESAKGTGLLIHGFPQTSYQFRHVIAPLSNAGYHIIAPDYRGAGSSSKPWNGYTKSVMAEDLHTLLQNLGVKEKIHLVGHDIGGMIAHAFAMKFPNDTASIAWGECPIPGTPFYHTMKHTLPAWHFVFHNVPDLPEVLVQGNERIYLKHFYDRLAQITTAISTYDLDVYATAYVQPGSLRAAFNVYRTFEQDAEDNDAWLKEYGKSRVRCLSLWGGGSWCGEEGALGMCDPFYENTKFEAIPDAGHWIAEEKPDEFVKGLVGWFTQS